MTEMNVISVSGDGYVDFRCPGAGLPFQRLVVLGAVIALRLVGLFAICGQVRSGSHCFCDRCMPGKLT